MNVHRLFRPGAKRFTIRREARRIRYPQNPIGPRMAGAKDVAAPAEVIAEVEQLNEQRERGRM